MAESKINFNLYPAFSDGYTSIFKLGEVKICIGTSPRAMSAWDWIAQIPEGLRPTTDLVYGVITFNTEGLIRPTENIGKNHAFFSSMIK